MRRNDHIECACAEEIAIFSACFPFDDTLYRSGDICGQT